MSGGPPGQPSGGPHPARHPVETWSLYLTIAALVAWSALVVSGHPFGLSLARSGAPAATGRATGSPAAGAPSAHLLNFRALMPPATTVPAATAPTTSAPTTSAPTTAAPTTVSVTTTLPRPKPVAPPTVPTPTTTAPPVVRAAAAPVVAPTTAASAQPSGYGCAAALVYLAANSAPGFHFECPGYADGHQAMTCINEPGLCPNESLIAISDPCPAAYMNEAHNSWVLAGLRPGSIDPYGYCH